MAKISHILSFFIFNLFFCRCDDFTLNLTATDGDPDYDKFNKTTYHIDGLACRKLAPTPHNRIIKVVDGKTPIWVGNKAECTGIIVYPEVGHARLLHLFIAKATQNIHEYYTKEGDKWKKIDEVRYKERMSEFFPSDKITDYTKSKDKKKLGSTYIPNILSVLVLPILLYTFLD